MELQEVADNDETVGFSKRRISSILKVPRKSARFTDQEQQENVVQCAKPFEKRSSKRVSFAPGDNVLVFSKDVKSTASSQRIPQELKTVSGETTQNRVTGAGDGTQNMMGKQSVLNDPLRASQDQIRCDRDEGIGEKTVVFSSDDAYMDMTQSHSVNVAHYTELLEEGFPNFGEKTVMFTANDASMDLTLNHTMKITEGNASRRDGRHLDLNVDKRSLPSTIPILDLGFEGLLASLSKPSLPASNNSFPHMGSETRDVDKENWLPASRPAGMEKSINTFRNHAEASQRSVLFPDNDVSMNLTEVQTSSILGITDANDQFKFIFPTQDTCVSTDKSVPQKNETNRTSSVSKDMTFSKNTHRASTQKHKVDFDAGYEKTIIFNTDNDFMDPTQSCTVNIARAVAAPQKVSADGLDLGFNNFLSGLFKTPSHSGNNLPSAPGSTKGNSDTDSNSTRKSAVRKAVCSLNTRRSCRKSSAGSKEDPGADVDMDLTEARTTHLANSVDPLHLLFPTQEPHPQSDNLRECVMKNTRTQDDSGLRTSLKSSVKTSLQKHQFGEDHQEQPAPSSSHCGESYTFCMEGDISMDMTEAQTGRIVGITHPDDPPQRLHPAGADLKTNQGYGMCSTNESSTVCPEADVSMDMTETQTGRIHTGKQQAGPTRGRASLAANGRRPSTAAPTSNSEDTICLDGDISMDMTEAQTGRIFGVTPSDAAPLSVLSTTQPFSPEDGNSKSKQRYESHGAPRVRASLAFNARRPSTAAPPSNDLSTLTCPDGDISMDLTRAQTGRIVEIALSHDDPHLSSQGVYPQGSDLKIQTAQMTSKQTGHFATDSVLPQTNKQQFGATWGRPSLAPHAKMPSTVAPPSNARRSTVVCPDGDVSMDMTETQTGRIVGLTPADDPQLFVASPDVYPETRDLKRQTESVLYTRKQQAGPTRGRASLAFNARRPSTAAPPLNDDPSTVTCPDVDISMDLTRAQTGRIVEIALAHDDPHLSSQGAYPQGSDLKIQTAQMTSKQMEHFATDSVLPQTNKQQFGSTWGRPSLAPHAKMPSTVVPPSNARRSTVVGPDGDVSMDMTEVQTGRISGIMPIDDPPQPPSATPKYDKRGPNGHQTPSALIAKTPSTAAPFTNYQESDTVDDGCDVSMDMTEAQTGGILGVSGADDPTQCLSASQDAFQQNDDAAKLNLQSADPPGASVFTGAKKSLVERRQMTDSKVEEEQLRTDQAVPNVMSCLGRKSEVILPRQDPLLKFTHRNTDLPSTVKTTQRNRSLTARGRSLGFKSSFPLTGLPWANAAITKPVTTADQQPLPGGLEQPEENAAHVTADVAPGRDDHSQNETTRDFPGGNMSMDMTEVQTGHIPGPTSDVSPTAEPGPDLTKATLLQGNTQMDTHPHEAVNRETPEDKSEPKKTESLSGAAVEQNTEEPCSRKSRRISLANLQSKARRLSQMINAAPEAFALEGATSTLPQTDRDSDLKTLKDKTQPLPSAAPGPVRDVTWSKPQDSSKDECPTPEEVFPTTPHHLKTKLMSRLSVGAFKPKLPQRNTSSDTKKKKNSDDDVTKAMTVNLMAHLDDGDNDVSDIYEEELGSYEDVSETLDNSSPPKLDSKEPEEDDVPEEEAVAGKKRPLPKDENRGDENMKRRRSSTESSADVVGMHHQSLQEFDSNSAPNTTTHTTDYSSSSHASSMRCEGTFESTFKQSMFESQLEDYTSETQRKLDDGSMTVLEFLKLFNIDFVIHNPRQSVLPGKIPSETQRTQMDVLKDRHISLPRQLVYEEDVQELTEKVQGLKMRMQDLDKPLRMINKDLWEELRDSSEKELKSFGSSLKERNNFYKKMGKARSHEMKEVLYRNLVQTNQEEQQKLRGTIDRADEMIRSLDECIGQLESELAEIEEKGSEEKPSLKTLQEELETVTKAVAENERQQSELELQNKQNSSKTERLKVETKNLRKHVDTLHRITEWTFGDRTDDSTVYSFLYDSVHLQVDYGKSQETADGHSEREIKDIAFKLRLNDETSECHARLVHKLVSQFVRGQRSLVEKYPTSGHVPKLLHDVSLVVSRCRLLGEELRLLKMWGATKLDILDLTCLDTQVHVVFSSLKKLSKFQVVFSITLKQRLCVVKLERCSNIYGQAEIQKIDDIVASFPPGRNVFTKIIKRIHADLLR